MQTLHYFVSIFLTGRNQILKRFNSNSFVIANIALDLLLSKVLRSKIPKGLDMIVYYINILIIDLS